MDDNIRYAFCIEMAGKAERAEQLEAMNNWYARAWEILLKDSDYANDAKWTTYWKTNDA